MRGKHFDILVVDDDSDDLENLREAFAQIRCDHRMTVYPSAVLFQAALTELKSLRPLPRLVVLDYYLPAADGALLLALLKNDAVLTAVPVVMYSSGMSNTQVADCLAKGVTRCFQKGTTQTEAVAFARELCQVAFRRQPVN